ncbi:hypothetical protein MRX96_007484 [Rhipicephalus microplus]
MERNLAAGFRGRLGGRQHHSLPDLQKTGERAARRESAGRSERRCERGGARVPAVPGLVGGLDVAQYTKHYKKHGCIWKRARLQMFALNFWRKTA